MQLYSREEYTDEIIINSNQGIYSLNTLLTVYNITHHNLFPGHLFVYSNRCKPPKPETYQ